MSTLRRFWERHPDSELPLRRWYRETERANWDTPGELLMDYPNASIVGRDRAVFRIKGNNYRLVAAIDYRRRRIYIKFLGTHTEYDRVNAEEV